jgi:hypothetical protein
MYSPLWLPDFLLNKQEYPMSLDDIYKQGNLLSHEDGLKAVYDKGVSDATTPKSNLVEDVVESAPEPEQEVVNEQLTVDEVNTHTEQSSIVSNQEDSN